MHGKNLAAPSRCVVFDNNPFQILKLSYSHQIFPIRIAGMIKFYALVILSPGCKRLIASVNPSLVSRSVRGKNVFLLIFFQASFVEYSALIVFYLQVLITQNYFLFKL